MIAADEDLSVYWRGRLLLSEIPALIQSQTTYSVIVQGNRWLLLDPDGDKVPVVSDRSGQRAISTISRAEASARQVEDQLLSSLNNLTVGLWVCDAGGALSANLSHAVVSVDGLLATCETTVLDGSDFDVRDTESRQVEQYTPIGENAQRYQSGLLKVEAGLTFTGHVYSVGPKLVLTGSVELSRFTQDLNTTQRKVKVNVSLRRGEAVEIACLDRGDFSARLLQSWNVGAGVRRLRVCAVVR